MATPFYILFLNPNYPIRSDQLKYQFGLVNIGLDWLISVWIGQYQFGLVVIGLDWLISA